MDQALSGFRRELLTYCSEIFTLYSTSTLATSDSVESETVATVRVHVKRKYHCPESKDLKHKDHIEFYLKSLS